MSKRQRPHRLDDPLLQTFVGRDFIHRITQNDDHAPLRIGKQVWTTHDLATQLGVVHTRAARLLTVAADSIGATSVADLYRRSSPYTFAGVKGLGETVMYVLWRLFEANGLDPDRWAAGDTQEALVSFRAMKHREQAAEARTQKAARAERRREQRAQHERNVAAQLKTNDGGR